MIADGFYMESETRSWCLLAFFTANLHNVLRCHTGSAGGTIGRVSVMAGRKNCALEVQMGAHLDARERPLVLTVKLRSVP
jgi:hypothetical protein